ncbi:transcriptional regulator [Aeromonas veronii]
MRKIYLDVRSGVLFDENTKYGTLNLSERNILNELISSEGKTCSKERLLEVGWPGRVVVPAALNISIKNIRGALKNADLDRILVTVPREGYTLEPNFIFKYQDKYKLVGGIVEDRTSESEDRDVVASVTSTSENFSSLKSSAEETVDKFFSNRLVYNKIIYKYIYRIVIVTAMCSFLASIYIFMVTPSFECFRYKGAVLCGREKISAEEVTVPIYENHIYWFTREVDEDENIFHEIR